MNTFHLIISSPEGNIFEQDVVSLMLRGANGDLAILAGHIPFITSVVPCKAKIILENGEESFFDIESGILTVGKDKTILLSSSTKI